MKGFMKKGALVLVGTVAIVSVVFAAAVQGTEAKLKKGSRVGIVDVGGLAIPDAQKKVRIWWEAVRKKELTVIVKNKTAKKTVTPSQLGFGVDDVESVSQVPTDGLVGQVLGEEEVKTYPVKLKVLTDSKNLLGGIVKDVLGEPAPAKVQYVDGVIKSLPEQPSYVVDDAALLSEVLKALIEDGDLTVPLKEGKKKITDEVLSQITDVVAEFKTNFSAGNRPRSSNIKLASSKIEGLILLPGEKFSFNGTVGKRTIAGGFKEAGVYLNGRHDTGVGGGICQVSTTLYNACLFANLKIVSRTNHSMPVPYVPPGRDATVNYGAQDLAIENNMRTPIVISHTYTPGTLTFRILGKKEPGLEVKITLGKTKTWGAGSRREYDPSLPAGATKVVQSGTMGRSVSSFRTVYKNGEKVSTENLGVSYYAGGPRIIAYGPTASAKPPTSPPPVTIPPEE
jgi:vancomycin resistance protein YoaR